MRTLITLMTLTLCVPFAAARDRRAHGHKAPADHRVTWVDDEPMSRQAAQPASERAATSVESTGSRRDIQIQMTLTPVASVGAMSERGVSEDPTPQREAQPVSGALEELARRQMRRHQGSIDACTTAAVRRTPAATGSVTLKIHVGDKKVARAEVSEATLKDLELQRCLVKAAEGWKFSLSHATFSWPVVLSPTASR